MSRLYQPFQPLLTAEGRKTFGLCVKEHAPCARLSGVVHSYLQVNVAKPTPYPMIPDGTQAIFISLDSLQIGGAQSQAAELQLRRPGDYLGIRFYPGALRHFFSLDLAEITNRFISGDDIRRVSLADLGHQAYRHTDFHQRARVCEAWLLRHFMPRPPNTLDRAMNLIYQFRGNLDVALLRQKLGVSERHLRRLFQQGTGLSTKAFAQIVRIQCACKLLLQNPAASMQVAGNLGFFDQAHLLKEYKQRLLANPGAIFDRFMSGFYNTAGS